MSITEYPAEGPLSDGKFYGDNPDEVIRATSKWYRSLALRAEKDAELILQRIMDAEVEMQDAWSVATAYTLAAERIEQA